ncbi:MAG: hypothetical protein OXM61_09955 [Candidatus Poribacteria bacterium]|nr:hypothetical protein [Candidatus Poribacteria bacterium]
MIISNIGEKRFGSIMSAINIEFVRDILVVPIANTEHHSLAVVMPTVDTKDKIVHIKTYINKDAAIKAYYALMEAIEDGEHVWEASDDLAVDKS